MHLGEPKGGGSLHRRSLSMDHSADGFEPLKMSLEEWQGYEGSFHAADEDHDGRLSGPQAAPLMKDLVSDRLVLRVVWALIDQDKDGFVSVEEFCAGMHLARSAALGNSLPSMLPQELLTKPDPPAPADSAGVPWYMSILSVQGATAPAAGPPAAEAPNPWYNLAEDASLKEKIQAQAKENDALQARLANP